MGYLSNTVIYNPIDHTTIDFIDVNGKTSIYGETFEEVQKRYGVPLATGDWRYVHDIKEKMFLTKPERITEEEWERALGVLPPLKYRGKGGTYSFMCSEFMYGNVTACYVQIGESYFQLYEYSTITHDELVNKCLSFEEGAKL
jgi:hypothetical protein